MRRKLGIAVLAVLAISLVALGARLARVGPEPALQSGDLVFQTSSSRQSWALMWAAKSLFGHVGIVEVGKDGTFVLEAISRVSRTPLAQWKARGRFGRYAVFRVSGLSPVQREAVVAHARHYLGRRYDIYFTAKNDELYCSELAEKAYEEAGVPIGKFQKAGELDVDNFLVRALMRSRWQGHPLCHGRVKTFEACWDLLREDDVITPVALTRDPRVHEVWSNYP